MVESMTSTQVACGALLLFVFALVWSMVRENNKRKKEVSRKNKEKLGSCPNTEYSWDELEQISAYHKAQQKNSFVIDEITWNDLDMDRIFMLMNQTVSSAGEDYLYAMLHRPEFSEERLKERERLFCFLKKKKRQEFVVSRFLQRFVNREDFLCISQFMLKKTAKLARRYGKFFRACSFLHRLSHLW